MMEALEHIERELMRAARVGRRRRASSWTAAVAVAGALLVLSAGSAVSGVGPVPALDDEAPSPLKVDSAAEFMEMEVGTPTGGSVTLRGTRGADRSLCVEVPPRPSPDASVMCADYSAIAKEFDRVGLILNIGGAEGGDVHYLYGLVRADAVGVSMVDQSGQTSDLRLTKSWASAKPGDGRAPDGVSQAPTVAAAAFPARGFVLASAGQYPTTGKGIELEVQLKDGRVMSSVFPEDFGPQ